MIGLVLFLAFSNKALSADIVVIPNSLASLEGNSNNGFPFNILVFSLFSQRYQQVFAGSEFVSVPGPVLITQIAFRPDVQAGLAFSSTISNIQINLSTTNKAPDGLSNFFSNNVGSDDTVVYSGALSLSSAFTGPVQGPKDFDIIINLQTPFTYNPALGNLLFDVRNFSGGSTAQFDAHIASADPISRTYTNVFSGDVNSSTGIIDSSGLVAKFTVSSVSLSLADKAVELAKEVVGAPYLGDGFTWGGKGWEYVERRYVEPSKIKTGYRFWNNNINIRKQDFGAGLDCSAHIPHPVTYKSSVFFSDGILTLQRP